MGIGEVSGPVAKMIASEAFRQKYFHRLPQQFGAAVAEQPFRLGIDNEDTTAIVDGHHGIRGGLHDLLKQTFAFLSYFMRALSPYNLLTRSPAAAQGGSEVFAPGKDVAGGHQF